MVFCPVYKDNNCVELALQIKNNLLKYSEYLVKLCSFLCFNDALFVDYIKMSLKRAGLGCKNNDLVLSRILSRHYRRPLHKLCHRHSIYNLEVPGLYRLKPTFFHVDIKPSCYYVGMLAFWGSNSIITVIVSRFLKQTNFELYYGTTQSEILVSKYAQGYR